VQREKVERKRNRREHCGYAVQIAERLWTEVQKPVRAMGIWEKASPLDKQNQQQRQSLKRGRLSLPTLAAQKQRVEGGAPGGYFLRNGLWGGFGLDEVAEAAEETERSLDGIILALLLLHGGLGTLAAAPEDGTIMGVENGEKNLCDIGGSYGAAAGRRRAATATAGAYAYAGVSNRSIDGNDEVGLRGIGDEDVVAPALEGVAYDIVGKASAGMLYADGAGGHEARMRGDGRGPGRLLPSDADAEQKRRDR
jgi:hypothetical protein